MQNISTDDVWDGLRVIKVGRKVGARVIMQLSGQEPLVIIVMG